MAPDGTRTSSSSAVKTRNALKKGPWTTSEDMILVEYVKKHGEGNWNAVQRNSGLMRCGKSCRLRWANHLRPNLKKGAFTAEEEKFIADLHAKLGNKWARMAAQLPGRTDNEIKNYWNTRMKRRQRAGLPIYPQELLQQERKQLNSSASSLLASSNPNNPLRFYDNFSSSAIRSPQNLQPNPYINNQLKLLRSENGSLALSLAASKSSFSSSNLPEVPYFNPWPMPFQIQYDPIDYGIKTGPEMGVLGLPSIQSPLTPAASSSDFVMTTTSSDCAEDYEGFSRCNNSGLLEDLLGESQALGCNGETEESFVAADENVHEKAAFGFGNSVDNYEGQELAKSPGERNASMDDDLMNLLDNFPLSVPIPDWDEGHGHESQILTNGTNGSIESQPDALEYNPVAASTGAANQDWQFGSCLWNNMPSIY